MLHYSVLYIIIILYNIAINYIRYFIYEQAKAQISRNYDFLVSVYIYIIYQNIFNCLGPLLIQTSIYFLIFGL